MATDLNDTTDVYAETMASQARTLEVAARASMVFLDQVKRLLLLDEELVDAEIVLILCPHSPDEVKH